MVGEVKALAAKEQDIVAVLIAAEVDQTEDALIRRNATSFSTYRQKVRIKFWKNVARKLFLKAQKQAADLSAFLGKPAKRGLLFFVIRSSSFLLARFLAKQPGKEPDI